MKIITENYKVVDEDILIPDGTCLQCEIGNLKYQKIVEIFGKPGKGDKYKTDAEWAVLTPDGVATIYNYKDGKNYLGEKGLAKKDIKEWHIGGHSKAVVPYVLKALGINE